VLGLKKVLWEGAELYRAEAKNDETMKRYGAGTPDDWMERHVYSHSVIGVSILMIINLILFGPIGLTIWAVQMVWIPFWAAGIVNGVGHYYGYRNFTCPDASTNLIPWGIIIGGEELHNNHHAFGTSAKLSNKWYEFDIGWLYIRTMEVLGLAKVKKVAPRPKLGKEVAEVNAETLDAVITHRFDLMTRYGKAIRHEFARTLEHHKREHTLADKKTMRQASRWVAGDLDQMPAELRQPVDSVLAESPALTKLCTMRTQLVAIWEKTNASREQLVQSLQEWCKQAEASGVHALEELSVRVRRYVI
jgi:stearoyl-CoA desaturase (delta-9 desaturase)